MFYIFGYLSDAILYLLLREIYPCWHSTLVNVVRYVQKKKTKMIRILTVPPFFPSIKLPWNYLNRRKKVNVMVIVPGFFFCYYAHSYLDYPNVLCRINMTQLDTCVKKTTRHNTTQTTHTKNIFSSCYRTRGVYTGIWQLVFIRDYLQTMWINF